jgi:hypothetical protein
MPFLILSGFLLFAAYPFIGSTAAVWVLAGSQLALLVGEIRKKQVSGVGGFIFMSFLFFSVRPIYLIVENDYRLFMGLFRIRADLTAVGDALWWGTAALLCFALGAYLAPRVNRRWFQRRRLKASAHAQALVSVRATYALMCLQLLSLPLMFGIARGGRGLYGSAFGAYLYDLPVLLQSIHIVAVVVLLERYLRTKTPQSLVLLGVSVFLFLDFTWLMRGVSMFRGFYITGLMIVCIAALQRIKGRVGFAWLIIPIIVVQPFFKYLGEVRGQGNEVVAEGDIMEEVVGNRTLAETYWTFYDSRGDMNIFDTFVAARNAEPKFYPYAWSWLYVPLHLIPRALWSSKPRKGITMDIGFLRGFPYSPGIAGFLLLDGGLIWMLGSMALLGFLISTLDGWVATLPRGYLQCCLIAIVTVNAMFLSRFLLWQYVYQILYSMIPVLLVAWLVSPKTRRANFRRQTQEVLQT